MFRAIALVVLEEGRVVQTGTLDELFDGPGLFARLWGERRVAATWAVATLDDAVRPRGDCDRS